jgi:LmbE family N-acetylglucosaminyl deacetylase
MMPPVAFVPPQGRPLRLLCLGAHCDDIEIGCGGTLLRMIEAFPDIACHWVVLSSNSQRRQEALSSAAAFLDAIPESHRKIAVESFRESYFPWVGAEIKDYFLEHLAVRARPDLIFTHCRDDRHQDHRVVSDLTWNTFRDHMILEYEVPKYDGDLATPNLYVTLGEATADRKIELLLEHFPSQGTKRWFDADTFRGLMRLRGVESNAPERFAEGFYSRKAVL